MGMDITSLSSFVSSASTLPLYTVGSGGSLSAAHFVACLQQRLANQFAKAITPLEAVALSVPKQSCFWFFSAGGRNADINDAFKEIVIKEPKHLCITCARSGSPLARYAQDYEYTEVFNFNLPSQKDGFLATNSLLAFTILAFRAYQDIYFHEESSPKCLEDLLPTNCGSLKFFLNTLRDLCAPIFKRDSLIVLFGPSTQPAAFDLESKFTEAALGHVLLADYRNFAHGRHHWLAKRGETSAVLAFTTDREKRIADRTIALLPPNVPVVHINFSDQGVYAPVSAMLTVLYIVALAGEAQSIDPGRPGVPAFGGKIYHLRGIRNTRKNCDVEIIIDRKAPHHLLQSSEKYEFRLREESKKFIHELQRKDFSAVVFDYDGTLCSQSDRFVGIDASIAEELLRLLKAGVPIGIATGRGKSVRISLRQAIPNTFFDRVIIGYYNGAECGHLSDDSLPDNTDEVCAELIQIHTALYENNDLQYISKITPRKYQITVESLQLKNLQFIWEIINSLIHQFGAPGTKAFLSTHSVDILAPSVTKLNVIDTLMQKFRITPDSSLLCIGDMGAWPGNDCELLNRPFSLSVDQVSPDFKSCWNIAPAGYRGVQATLYYLKCMHAQDSITKFKMYNSRGDDTQ